MNTISLVALLGLWLSAADPRTCVGSLVEDETCLFQMKQVLNQGSERSAEETSKGHQLYRITERVEHGHNGRTVREGFAYGVELLSYGNSQTGVAVERRSIPCTDDDEGVSMEPVVGTDSDRQVVTVWSQFCAHISRVTLGKGGTGSVKKGFDEKAKVPLALKSFQQDEADDFNNEVTILAHLHKKSKHIMEIYGVAADPSPPYVFASEYLSGGDMLGYMMDSSNTFTLKNAAKATRQVILAVRDCHAQGVAHRDVKPEQFVFAKSPLIGKEIDGSTPLRLIDFGFAKWLPDSKFNQAFNAKEDSCDGTLLFPTDQQTKEKLPTGSWSWVGTPEYVSPELAQNYVRRSNQQACERFSAFAPDVWAAGMMAFGMTSRLFAPWVDQCPIDGKEHIHCMNNVVMNLTQEHVDKVIADSFDNQGHRKEGKVALDFILAALRVNPHERPTASELLKHPWLASM